MSDRITRATSGSGGVVLAIASLLVLLPVLYVGSYAALIDCQQDCGLEIQYEPHYRYVDCPFVHAFYQPLHQFDRRLRPDVWQIDVIVYF